MPPLTLPPPGTSPTVATLAFSEAVALFVARSRAVRPDFALTDANAGAVAGICRAVDGLPLALELAAARAKLLDPATMLARLEHRLDLLTAGARDSPARQHTLRATIDWSYELLGPGERTLFARLAVFPGSCSLDAAEAVCGATLDALAALVDHSLLRQPVGGDAGPRFAMLETVREYALERLSVAGEHGGTCRRHAEHFLALAERLEPTIREPSTLDALARDHDNLRAALAFFRAAPAPGPELRLCAAVARFWYVRGHLVEGRQHVDHALAVDDGTAPDRRAAALDGASRLAWVQGDYEGCIRYVEESLVLYEALGDDVGSIRAHIGLGLALQASGELERARGHHAQSLALARGLGRRREEGLALGNLGDVAIMLGAYDDARDLFAQSLVINREVGDAESTAIALMCLGLIALRGGGDRDEAGTLFGESLALFLELGFTERVGTCLAGLAAVGASDDAECAACRLGAAHALLDDIGALAEIAWERPLLAETGAALREQLGDDAFARAFERGRAAPDDAVQTAAAAGR